MVDIPRESNACQRRPKRALLVVFGIGVVTLIIYGVLQLQPAAPGVERSTLYIGEVNTS